MREEVPPANSVPRKGTQRPIGVLGGEVSDFQRHGKGAQRTSKIPEPELVALK